MERDGDGVRRPQLHELPDERLPTQRLSMPTGDSGQRRIGEQDAGTAEGLGQQSDPEAGEKRHPTRTEQSDEDG